MGVHPVTFCTAAANVDLDMKRVCQHSDTTSLVDRSDGIGKVHIATDRCRHPQRQDMPITAADFDSRDDLKRVTMLVVQCPQAGLQCVMVSDSDHVQVTSANSDVVQQGFNLECAIAGSRVDM